MQPLVAEDLERVFAAMGDGVILVGGQALGVWITVYGLDSAVTDVPVSVDVDVYAKSSKAVDKMAKSLNATALHVDFENAGPSLGAVRFVGHDGAEHHLDLLGSVCGFEAREIEQYAVDVDIGKHKVNVMHPVHVLRSRAKNILELKGRYATPHGFQQLRWAVQCVHAYLASLTNPTVFSRWARDIAKWQLFWARPQYFVRLDAQVTNAWVELIEAIPSEMPPKFLKEWEIILERLRDKKRTRL